jgi:hypothetical protein
MVALVAFAALGGLLFGAAPARAGGAALTPAKLAAELSAAATMKTAPPNLDPSLDRAANAKPLILLNHCSLKRPGVKSKPCVYGDAGSHTTVALFGDSHASTWFPALYVISNQQHWRLLDFTKADCPPPEVNISFSDFPYPQCTAWRHNAEAQIAAIHPALVIVSGARWLENVAQPEQGVPASYRSTWISGLAATFAFLRQAATNVVFISDVPTLASSAPACVASNISEVDQCATDRNTAVLLPQVKSQEIALARRMHIDWIDPTPWFCTATICPAIVGNILLYRDNAHMTPIWSRYIAPVLADSLLPIMHATRPT